MLSSTLPASGGPSLPGKETAMAVFDREQWLAYFRQKPNISTACEELSLQPQGISVMIDIMGTDRSSVKFNCEKAVRALSETRADLVYPYFDRLAGLLSCDNNFIRWGAIQTIANLVSVDVENRYERIHEKYFSLVRSDTMVTAANVIGGSWKIVLAKPGLESDITERLLDAASHSYLYRGAPSPECSLVVAGHLIDCFDRYFHFSTKQDRILAFVAAYMNSPRKAVVKKAIAFLKKHAHAV
jgi:hypothetical protein